jgi:hypothetical protein
MDYLLSQWTRNIQIKYFKFDWTIYRLFVPKRGWKRDFLQVNILVYACSIWGIVELKMRFETWITRNDVNGVSLINLCYLVILMTYLCSQRNPKVQIKYVVWLVDLKTSCAKYGLETWFTPNEDIRKYLLDMNHSSAKISFRDINNINDVNGVSLYNFCYLITLMPYLCTQRTPNVQIMYFMFDCFIWKLFVLNTGWKRDSLQRMIFVNVCSTWGIVELKRVLRRD